MRHWIALRGVRSPLYSDHVPWHVSEPVGVALDVCGGNEEQLRLCATQGLSLPFQRSSSNTACRTVALLYILLQHLDARHYVLVA